MFKKWMTLCPFSVVQLYWWYIVSLVIEKIILLNFEIILYCEL